MINHYKDYRISLSIIMYNTKWCGLPRADFLLKKIRTNYSWVFFLGYMDKPDRVRLSLKGFQICHCFQVKKLVILFSFIMFLCLIVFVKQTSGMKKKIDSCYFHQLPMLQKHPAEVFCKKRNFTKFTIHTLRNF